MEFDTLFKNKMLSTFKSVLAFFQDFNIEYYACGGTAIGAVRHHNIIPWDDDIDIYVKRKDYNRLLSLTEEASGYGLEIKSFYDKGYNHSFVKLLNKQTTIWEQESVPIVSGIWVDVFPLDSVDKDSIAEAEYMKYHDSFLKYQDCIKPDCFSLLIKNVMKGRFGLAFYHLKCLCKKPFKSYYFNKFKLIDNSVQLKEGDSYICYSEGSMFFYKKEWFDHSIFVDFSDFKIRIPALFDEYLTSYYGDYMTPPPAEQQVPYHGIYYTNLEKRLSIKDIKNRIKSGVYKNNPYENVYLK